MTKEEQHNEWHKQLRVLCRTLLASEEARLSAVKQGMKELSEPSHTLVYAMKMHFEKVAKEQGTDMDGILGYEDMLDYAKWYVSGQPII